MGLQVTRPTSASSAASKPSPSKDSKDAKDKEAGGSSPGSEAEEKGADLPPVTTLLEFVAWVVLTGHPVGTKAVEDWAKRRGGYLMDELDQVKEASIRVQVSQLQPAACNTGQHQLDVLKHCATWHNASMHVSNCFCLMADIQAENSRCRKC